jgi:hypothetical protein
MRRVLAALAIGGVLLTATACSGDDKPKAAAAPSPTPAASPSPSGPDYSANTLAVCTKLQTIFNADMNAFGTQVGKMIAYKEAKQSKEATAAQKAAQAQLKAVGEKVRTETAAALDPQLQQAGATSADKFVKTAADPKFFDAIKSTTDLGKNVMTQMTEWLDPVAGYCA